MSEEPRYTTADNSLSVAQTARTKARLAWIDMLMDSLVAVFPERKAELELMRIDLHASNTIYTDVLNAADLALVNRLSAMFLNEQLRREAGDEALRQAIQGRRIYEGERE